MTSKLFSSTTTPLTPPKLEEDRLSWLRLFRSRRVGVAIFHRLIGEHGTADAALAALPAIARDAGVEDYEIAPVGTARAEMDRGRRAGARLICLGDADYPALLSQIDDAPPLFWAIGDLRLLGRPMIALVGARNASGLGERMARRLAAELGEAGFVIVSGLARGIDAAAHKAALPTGTLAVLGGGVDTVYPKETAELFGAIGRDGLRLSEQPMGLAPQARHFPARNRIISGLASALVVVEAASKSGSLITARNALDQGREVLAVPGHPFDARASGCNMLIRDGARLVRSASDIIEALGANAAAAAADPPASTTAAPDWRAQAGVALRRMGRPANRRRKAPPPARLHQSILDRLGPTPQGEDDLIRDLGLSAQDVAPALTDLELSGRITRHPGGAVSLTVAAPLAERH